MTISLKFTEKKIWTERIPRGSGDSYFLQSYHPKILFSVTLASDPSYFVGKSCRNPKMLDPSNPDRSHSCRQLPTNVLNCQQIWIVRNCKFQHFGVSAGLVWTPPSRLCYLTNGAAEQILHLLQNGPGPREIIFAQQTSHGLWKYIRGSRGYFYCKGCKYLNISLGGNN